MNLKELKIGKIAIIDEIIGEGALRQHFLDMGLIPGATVKIIKYAPMGDPIEVRVHGYELTLRLAEAENIKIHLCSQNLDCMEANEKQKKVCEERILEKQKEHKGLGEGGKYHEKKYEKPLPDGTKLTFALAGNQNCGKTTLFNQLTGSNQHVGNFPGVTVDKKMGPIKGHSDTEVIDLPGIYSLSPYSSEEIVSRQFILEEKPTGIINIVDATNIERNLYLSLQLMELDIPLVIAVNMMDELRGNDGAIDVNGMEQMLGVPVVPISAVKNEGIQELIGHAIHIAKYQETPEKKDYCDEDINGGAVHRCLHGIMHLIDDHAKKAEISTRFAATKLVEGDPYILEALKLSKNETEMIEHIILQMEEERGLDRAAAIAEMRFAFIERVSKQNVKKPTESKERERSRRIDKVLTGRFSSLPCFVAIMSLIFWLTFGVVGAALQSLFENLIADGTKAMDVLLTDYNVNEVIHSLIIDGIFNGVGSVLSFLPIIVTLFFFLSLLEDTGYMARIAFVMDKLLRKMGLSGRSIVPMLVGFGCSVPAIMATRTLPSERDRKLTIMMIPFMSCTAKLPIYAFFTAAFFPKHGAIVMIGLYFTGMIISIVIALISKKMFFRGEAVPFVMELPNYRMPGLKNVWQLLWEKSLEFMKKAFTIIFLATIVIWLLQSFDYNLSMVSDSKESILAGVSGAIAPFFEPLGFGDWRLSSALISGFIAKESVVSTISVLFTGGAVVSNILTPLTAMAFLVFCLLYTPCVAAVASVKSELGARWAIGIVIMQCSIAWLCAFIVKIIGAMIGF